jgi:hypothetical protein
MEHSENVTYKRVIDRLVHSCLEGQGQIGARRARAGLWNANADDAELSRLDDQRAMNELLRALTPGHLEVLAQMLAQEFQSGVHETLVVLHEEQLPPFEDGMEGTPFQDFVGRLADWDWPAS